MERKGSKDGQTHEMKASEKRTDMVMKERNEDGRSNDEGVNKSHALTLPLHLLSCLTFSFFLNPSLLIYFFLSIFYPSFLLVYFVLSYPLPLSLFASLCPSFLSLLFRSFLSARFCDGVMFARHILHSV